MKHGEKQVYTFSDLEAWKKKKSGSLKQKEQSGEQREGKGKGKGTPFQPLTSTHLCHISVTLRDISVVLRDISMILRDISMTFPSTSVKDSVYTIVLTYHCSILSLLIVVYNLGLILAEDPSYSFRTSCYLSCSCNLT